jgi:hypothetical protein
MVYTVDFEGDANLRVNDITILRNATFSNLNTSSNLTVGTDDLFVDTTTGNVGIGTTNPGCALNINLDSETGSSNTTALIIQNQSSNYAQIANGFGSRIQFKTNRGTGPTSIWPSAEIKGYIYNGAGGTGDYHALDLDVYGDNVSLNRGISILSKSYLGGPADTIMHGNVGIRTTNPTSNLHVVGNAYVSSNLTVTGFVGVGTSNPEYTLDVVGKSSLGTVVLNPQTYLMSNVHYIEYSSSTNTTFNQVLLQFDKTGTDATDQAEYAGYVDCEIVAQRTVSLYVGPEIFTARVNFIAAYNDEDDVWKFTTFVQENKSVSADVANTFSILQSIPVFKYKYNGTQLQLYVSFNAKQTRAATSFTARITSDGDHINDISLPGPDELMGTGTDGTAELGICYGLGHTNTSSYVGIGTANPTSNLHVAGNAYVSSNLTVGTDDLHVDTTTGFVGIGTTNPSYTLDVNGNVRCNSFTLSQKTGEQGEFIVERKDNGYTQGTLPLAHTTTFQWNVSIPDANYTTVTSKVSFTINDDNTGSRWMLKFLHYDADTNLKVRVNAGTQHTVDYNDTPEDAREDNDLSWTTIDITDDVNYAGVENTIYFWHNSTDAGSIVAVYVFPMSGPALPNEPVETDLHLYNGLYVSSNLAVNTDDLFVDTNTGNVGIGTTDPKSTLDVRGPIVAPVVAYASNRDSAYLIAASTDYTGESTNWGTLGFHHKIKSNSSGSPRVTIDTPYGGESFSVLGTGGVGIGTDNPSVPLHVFSSNFVSDAVGPAASANNVFRVSSTEVDSTLLIGASDTGSYISSFSKEGFGTERNLILNANGGNVGIGTTNPTAQLTLGASSGSQIAVTNNTRLLSNTHYLNYTSSTATDVEQVLLQFDTGGTNGNDQSEYAGYIDVEMVAQRTGTPNYGPEIFAARLNYILGWNEYDDVWKITIVQENKSVSPDTVNTFTVFKSVPVFKYKYVDRQLQIYVSFNANYFRGYTSFTARVTSDNPADVSMPGPDALMASGTDGTAEIGMCYGYGAKAAYVGIGTTNPTSNLHVVGTAAISSNLAVNTDDLFVDTNTGNVGIGTANPNALLHIEQTLDPILRIQGTASDSNAYIELRETDGDNYGASLYYEGTSAVQGLRFGHFNASSTLRTDMAIDRNTGRVGIGITNPLGKLAVLSPLSNIEATDLNSLRSNAAINIRAYGDSNDYLSIGLLGSSANDGNNPSAYIQNRWDIGGLAADLLLQPGGGNVGIGTTNPSYTLDVNGNVRCNSFTLSQKDGEQGEFIVERKDNGYTQSALPLAHIDAFTISINIPDVDYTTTNSKLTFTIDDDNTGSRWMLKMLVRDAEGGASVRVNSGTTHELHYNDVPQDPREDNDDSWTTIDITDDVVYAGATNTIYWWAPTSDGSSVRAAYVFPTSGPALPNEPVETDLHLYNGLYVSSNLTVNTDDLFVDTNTGNVGIGTTNPSAVLHIVDFNVNSTTELLRLEKSDTNGDINDASIGYIGMYLQDANTGGGEVARISYGHAGDDIQGSGTGQTPEGKGKLGFWTSDTGFADGVPVERMTINHKGNVGIGTGSPRATLDINSTNSIIIPSGTEAQKSGTPVTGMIRFSTSKNGIEYYDGTQWKLLTTGSNSGSGGDDVFTLNGYRIHVYTSGGTFTANGNIDNLDVLMVGGGGGGGADNGGAGGAGGLIFKPKSYILSGDYTIQIGTGGTGAPDQGTTAGTGGDTTAFSLTAVGGGYGNNGNNGDGTANSGGSGGGGDGERITSGGSGTQPTQSGDSGTYGHGNDGGDTAVTTGGGGGGGGAGEAGSNGSTTIGGVGGDGLNEVTVSGVVYNFATIFGTDYGEIINGEAWFAGGGAGGNNNGSATSVAGGKGGGGSTANYYPDDGTTNTGGGGGGSTYTGSTVPAGANGGSGIVIIRYPL